MKDRLDSVVYMWISFGLIFLAVLMMFVPTFQAEGQTYNIVTSFEHCWPSFIGYMLILVGGIMTAILALPNVQPSYDGEKLFLIVASALEVVGVALVMTCVLWWSILSYGKPEYITHSGYFIHAGSYITMSLSALAVACNVRALWLDK